MSLRRVWVRRRACKSRGSVILSLIRSRSSVGKIMRFGVGFGVGFGVAARPGCKGYIALLQLDFYCGDGDVAYTHEMAIEHMPSAARGGRFVAWETHGTANKDIRCRRCKAA